MPKSNSSPKGAFVVSFLACALAFGALAAYVQNNPQAKRVPDEMRRQSESKVAPPPVDPGSEQVATQTVQHVRPSDDGVLEMISETIPKSEGPALYSTNATLRALGLTDARVLSIEIDRKVATLNVSRAFEEGFGSTEESQIIKALAMTLGQFETVNGFNLEVEGTRLETLGHFELENPIPVERKDQNLDSNSNPPPAP